MHLICKIPSVKSCVETNIKFQRGHFVFESTRTLYIRSSLQFQETGRHTGWRVAEKFTKFVTKDFWHRTFDKDDNIR